jgi:hypothetical protein
MQSEGWCVGGDNVDQQRRFDAIGLVTATNVWVDGCELQDQLSGEYVAPDIIPPGWQVCTHCAVSDDDFN